MTDARPLTTVRTYHVRVAERSAARAAADIAALLEDGVTLVDISMHDRFADVVTLRVDSGGGPSADDR